MDNLTEVGTITALVVILGKLVDLVSKFVSDKFGSNEKTNNEDRTDKKLDHILQCVERSAEIQSKVDSDGTPMVYYPRSAIDAQQQSNELLRDMQHTQNAIAKSIERSSMVLDNAVKVLTLMEDRMTRNK
jgi:hypothetical protein